MTLFAKRKSLLFFVIIATMVVVGIWYLRADALRKTRIVSVEAITCPSVCQLPGGKVTLTEVRRDGARLPTCVIDAESLKNNLYIAIKNMTPSVNSTTATIQPFSNNLQDGTPAAHKKSGISQTFELPKGTTKFDLSCQIELGSSTGTQKIKFERVSPSSVPVKKSYGPVSMTLNKIYYGKAPAGCFAGGPDAKRNYLVLVGTERGPMDGFTGKYWRNKTTTNVRTSTERPHWLLDVTAPATDEAGHLVNYVAAEYDMLTSPGMIFGKEISQRTLIESLVGRFNTKTESKMITNRALRAAGRSGETYKFAIVFELDHMPKRITWEPSFYLEPQDRRDFTVVFKDIRMPPK